ncbi:MAG: DUF4294 domain-containing protein [Chitinophagales bacterium]|nr:DUF4294 domain-containing protein [Chitinophagales bacterium]
MSQFGVMKNRALFVLFMLPLTIHAQTGMLLPAVVVGRDTFPAYQLQDVVVVSKRIFKSGEDQSRFNALKRNVLVVYPFAKEAGGIFNEVNAAMASMDKRKERKRFIKQKEEELNVLFEGELKNLTITQGEILCKLVARETGNSVYDLIREFKNPLSAFYWNKMSQFLGYSLRYEYDPQQEKDIEFIVRSIEGNY